MEPQKISSKILDLSVYATLETEIQASINRVPGYEGLVNFKENEKLPIHRWYHFKEGFAAELVEKMLDEFHLDSNALILDIFAGCGTTLLSAQLKGMHAIGLDVDPFFTFLQRAKLDWFKYDLDDIGLEIDNLRKLDMRSKSSLKPPELSSFNGKSGSLFAAPSLKRLLLLKEKIAEIRNELTNKLFRFALASILEEISRSKKDGKGLRIVQNKQSGPIKEVLLNKLTNMKDDLVKTQKSQRIEPKHCDAFTVDARRGDEVLKVIGPQKAGFTMFSPPYLNTFDYTEIYKLELWFLDFVKNYDDFKKLRAKTLRSHNLYKWQPTKIWQHNSLNAIIRNIEGQCLWSKSLPTMIQGYFDDMYLSLLNLNKVLQNNAHCVIVVGNSSYGNTPIPTDLLLSRASVDAGFEVEEIRIARQRYTSAQQLRTIKDNALKKYLRESIIVLRKK
jgi:hypothetical protein